MHVSKVYIFLFILSFVCGFVNCEENEEDTTPVTEVAKLPEDTAEEEKSDKDDTATEESEENPEEEDEEEPKPEKPEESITEASPKAEEEELTSTLKMIPETTTEAEIAKPPQTETPTIEKEEAPEDTYAIWSPTGRICLLAKFNASVTITYPSKGNNRTADIRVPLNGHASGKCGSSATSPVLQISWGKYAFKLTFNKTSEDKWFLSALKLHYDTSERLFDGAVDRGQVVAKNESLYLFETPFGKSYACHAQKVIELHTGNKKVAKAKLRDIHLQPYEVENGKFSEKAHCDQVDTADLEPFVQDETIPLAVGCTLALITLLILIGFSIHRAYNAAKVDYNSME